MEAMDIVVVTGMSGAGKTFVGSVLEDFGYFCIDNIPVGLLSQFIDLYAKQEGKSKKIALIIDVRGCENFAELIRTIVYIREQKIGTCSMLFLDAATETLINRYKETRHIHPLVLSHHITLVEALDKERAMLREVRGFSDFVLDTSTLSQAGCRERVLRLISGLQSPKLCVQILSFGFKNGIPHDADLVFDVRCFPNPFYVETLKHKTGLDRDVFDYVFSFDSAKDFLARICALMDMLLPLYQKDGRSHLTVAFGCTGGKHRSVAMAEALFSHLSQRDECAPVTAHRDISR